MAADGDFFFDLLAGLPEKQIRRECRPHDCNEYREVASIEFKVWTDGSPSDLGNIRLREHGCANVREQSQSQPLESLLQYRVRAPYLEGKNKGGGPHDQDD